MKTKSSKFAPFGCLGLDAHEAKILAEISNGCCDSMSRIFWGSYNEDTLFCYSHTFKLARS